jgi:hypothetical protein
MLPLELLGLPEGEQKKRAMAWLALLFLLEGIIAKVEHRMLRWRT